MRFPFLAGLFSSLAAACSGAAPHGSTLPSGGNWQVLAPMPARRQEVATAALGGKIFVIGGYDPHLEPSDSVFVFDTAANT